MLEACDKAKSSKRSLVCGYWLLRQVSIILELLLADPIIPLYMSRATYNFAETCICKDF